MLARANVQYNVMVSAILVSPVYSQPYALVLVARDSVVRLTPTVANDQLLQSSLSLAAIPFIPAIIGMSVISFLILVAILTILIANRYPGNSCKTIEW
jgi:hypothetical protein